MTTGQGQTDYIAGRRSRTMAKHVGANWAGKGWLTATIEDGAWELDHHPSMLSLWKYHSDAERILVTVPIGLPTTGRRRCDLLAKERVDRHRGSVPYAPIRPAVYEGNLEAAKRRNERAGYSIQNQTWGVVPRIREVDEFLDAYPGARDRVHETHPEVCFAAYADEPLVEPPRTDAGIERRLAVLEGVWPPAGEAHRVAVERYMRPSFASFVGAERDVLDALVAAVTASLDGDRLAMLPNSPPRDGRGLPMGIVYPSATRQARLPLSG